MLNLILAAAGGALLVLAIVLWPVARSRWQQRNEPPPLSHWAGGRLPEWPESLAGKFPETRAPIGPSLPKVIPSGTPGKVVEIGRGVA